MREWIADKIKTLIPKRESALPGGGSTGAPAYAPAAGAPCAMQNKAFLFFVIIRMYRYDVTLIIEMKLRILNTPSVIDAS